MVRMACVRVRNETRGEGELYFHGEDGMCTSEE